MAKDDWKRITDLFAEARRLPSGERAGFLDRECRDAEVRAEVDSLLAHDSDDFLSAATRPDDREVPEQYPFHTGNDRYRILRRLAVGGQKAVYVARDCELERDVVICHLLGADWDDVTLQRFRREARTMARLDDHPHIVRIFDIGEHDGAPFLVTQHIEGGTVEDLLRTSAEEPLPLDRAVQIAEQTCRALAHAHAQGIIHRDVKPANLLLTPEGVVKLADFGIAAGLEQLTRTGVGAGTAYYMSPEQALGREVGPASDLYSLGVMLYEMLTGTKPFRGDTVAEVVAQHLNSVPQQPSRLNPRVGADLEELLADLLAKRIEDRPSSAETVLEALVAARKRAAGGLGHTATRRQGGTRNTVFVGREREMEELGRMLEKATSGRGGVVLVAGDPGSGKTRLAEELMGRATLHGIEVLVGRCSDEEGMPPFWPWVQMLRTYCQSREVDAIRQRAGAGLAHVAQLDGELRDLLGIPDDRVAGKSNRFQLFESLTNFLRGCSSEAPLLLVVDDLHWADEPSLRFLEFLSQEIGDLPILVAGTMRRIPIDPAHPLTRTLGEISRCGVSQRIELGGLALEHVERFLTDMLGHGAWSDLARAVWQKTEGNPFFVSEIVRLLIAEGHLEKGDSIDAWMIEIPPAVTSVILRRLTQLSQGTLDVLTLAAVIGREFSLEVLEGLEEGKSTDALDALEEGVAHRLLEEVTGSSERYSFTHSLIRETLAGRLSRARRARLHGRIGRLLERLPLSGSRTRSAELAYHFSEASGRTEAEKATLWSSRAAAEAMAQHAYEEAVRYYDMALEALGRGGREDERQRCAFLVAAGEAHRQAGNVAAAVASFEEAVSIARARDWTEELVRAALGLERAIWRTGLPSTHVVHLLEEVMERIGEEDTADRAMCLTSLARTLRDAGERERAARHAQEAMDVARRVGDTACHVYLLYGLIEVWSYEHVEQKLEFATDVLHLAKEKSCQESLWEAHSWRQWCLMQLGRVEEARVMMEEQLRLAARSGRTDYRYAALCYESTWALLEGRFETAERAAGEAHALGRRIRANNVEWIYGLQMFSLRRDQGRLHEVAPAVRMLVEQKSGDASASTVWRPGLALVYAELGMEQEARNVFEELASEGFADLVSELWMGMVAYLSDVCAYLGDAERAAILYRMMLPFADQILVVGGTMAIYGSASRNLGHLAATMGDYESAEKHFEKALAVNTRCRARTWLARTACQYAEMLLTRNRRNDAGKARQLLTEAGDLAGSIGMRGLIDRIRRIDGRSASAPAP